MAKEKSVSPRQFFNQLDLSQLDAESANYIRTEILADTRLDLLPDDTQEYQMVIDLIKESYPKAVGTGTETHETPAVVVVETPAITPTKMSKEQLISRLKLLKKMLAKDPSNKIINGRIKLVGKMIQKA